MRRRGKREEAKALRKQRQKLPSINANDETYRRLYYVRYADDTLFGFAGPRSEAEEIKQQLGHFLHGTLKLEMSQEKTLITQASTEAARFLNYHIVNQYCDTKQTKKRRTANGRIGLLVPPDVVESKCALYQRAGKSHHRPQLLENDDFMSTPAYFCARIILTPLIIYLFVPTVDDLQGSRLRLCSHTSRVDRVPHPAAGRLHLDPLWWTAGAETSERGIHRRACCVRSSRLPSLPQASR